MKWLRNLGKRTLGSMGYRVVRAGSVVEQAGSVVEQAGSVVEQYSFSGNYTDASAGPPTICCEPGEPKWYADKPVIFIVNNGLTVLRQEVLYSSLTLLKMLKHCQFETVLDIGSHAGNAAKIFAHLGKKVTTCEISPGFTADYKDDYLNIRFPIQFDAIWCSQILEHQRNIGFFLNKVFDDLWDGGVLALTVPYEAGPHLSFGHCNHFNPLLLIYHLVMAGFDCREICLCCYGGDIGVILRKKYNGIDRTLPQGTLRRRELSDRTCTCLDVW